MQQIIPYFVHIHLSSAADFLLCQSYDPGLADPYRP